MFNESRNKAELFKWLSLSECYYHSQELLRRCCEQTISSLLNGDIEPQAQKTHRKKENSKQLKDRGKIRHSRASMRKQRNDTDREKTENTMCGSKVLSDQSNRTLISDAQNYNCTLVSLKDLHSGNRTLPEIPETELRINSSFSSGHPKSKKVQHNRQNGTWKLQNVERKGPVRFNVHAGTVNGEQNHNNTPENMPTRSKDDGADSDNIETTNQHRDSLRHSVEDNNHHEKNSGKNSSTHEMIDNKTADVKERELKQQQTLTGFDSISKSQLHSPQNPKKQTGSGLQRHHSCVGCQEDEDCECNRESWSTADAAYGYKGVSRILRNNEAVWAAAALGFLLVLLTLSVLHTRLYRHWRTSPSLYWRDPKQDYDTVAGEWISKGPWSKR